MKVVSGENDGLAWRRIYVDWPWSSACWYEERRSVGAPIDWSELIGLLSGL